MKLWWKVAHPSYVITEDDVDLSDKMATFAAPGPSDYQEPKYQFVQAGSEAELIASRSSDLNCTVLRGHMGAVVYKRLGDEIFRDGE